MDALLSIPEAAAILGISRTTLYSLLNSGALASIRPTGAGRKSRRLVAPADLEAFIAASREG